MRAEAAKSEEQVKAIQAAKEKALKEESDRQKKQIEGMMLEQQKTMLMAHRAAEAEAAAAAKAAFAKKAAERREKAKQIALEKFK